MLTSARSISWGNVALQGLLAGLAGTLAFDAFTWLAILLPAHSSLTALWSASAATALGPAGSGPNAAPLGAGVHLIVGMVWGCAYAYLAATRPFLNRRWVLSGLAYGLAVDIMMAIVLLVSGHFEYPHTPNDFILSLIAQLAFFGLPVAGVVKALARPA